MTETLLVSKKENIHTLLTDFIFAPHLSLFETEQRTKVENIQLENISVKKFTNEYWTSKQRQAHSIHEVSYRACFKPQLPRFFIERLTNKNDVVYDPFSGRGTTVIEAALLHRNIIANDNNPISTILSKPRLYIPELDELLVRLNEIPIDEYAKAEIDLSMFYHSKTESEIVSLKNYFQSKKDLDPLDLWIQMVATNRLTGHSKNFFSVYTLPPNQAVLPNRQSKINKERNQVPEYKNVKKIIFIKSRQLLSDITEEEKKQLRQIAEKSLFLTHSSSYTPEIKDNSIQLTVTSPPFLDVVQYASDNWLRCWFANIDAEKISKQLTMSKSIQEWKQVMRDTFKELYRITKKKGYVAFEVGEVRNGKIKLDEIIVPIGLEVGFHCKGIVINEQIFTKTANIWGVKNNTKGTNTNRIVLFSKDCYE